MVLKLEKYINEIPLMVRNFLKALNNETRQGIIIYLLRVGSKSFTEMSKDLKLSKNTLSHHIKNLTQHGLIYNFYSRNEFDDKYSFYEISKLGKKLINNLMDFIIPVSSSEEDVLSITKKDYYKSREKTFYMKTNDVDINKLELIPIMPPLMIIAETGEIYEEISQNIPSSKRKYLFQSV